MAMKHSLLALFLLSISVFSARTEKPLPNILFLAIDDQNDWIGCMQGHPQIQTPHIDRLAKQGTLFVNAHCQSPLCNPSRTSLMTGLRPSTTGVYGLQPWFRTIPRFAGHVTLPQALKSFGYDTYTCGKIYHGGSGRRPKDQEFDVIGVGAGVGAKPPKKLVKTPNPHPLVDWGTFPHKDEDKGDWAVASWAVKTLAERKNQSKENPFFLSVGFFLPHVPCYATQKWFDLYPEETLKLPPFLAGDREDTPRFSWYLHWKLPEPRKKFLDISGEWKNHVRSYLACTSFVDSQIGRVLTALQENGFADNTIVVLWSDHGYHIGEKEITGKNTLWDRSTNVPLIFAGPGIRQGICKRPAELLDMYPTLLDLLGKPVDPKLEGHSLLPQLLDAEAPRIWPAITTHNHDNHGIRTERWRYNRYADGSEELYDMQADPNEWRNLAGEVEQADVIRELRQWLPQVNAKPAPGSRSRVLVYEEDKLTWENHPIPVGAKIPEYE